MAATSNFRRVSRRNIIIDDDHIDSNNAVVDDDMYSNNTVADDDIYSNNTVIDDHIDSNNAAVDDDIYSNNAAGDDINSNNVVEDDIDSNNTVVDIDSRKIYFNTININPNEHIYHQKCIQQADIDGWITSDSDQFINQLISEGTSIPITEIICGRLKINNFEDFVEHVTNHSSGSICSTVGAKISSSLIRVAVTRIFADPSQSIIELPVNSIDSYRRLYFCNGNGDVPSIGKFGLGFFSFLYWLTESPDRVITIYSSLEADNDIFDEEQSTRKESTKRESTRKESTGKESIRKESTRKESIGEQSTPISSSSTSSAKKRISKHNNIYTWAVQIYAVESDINIKFIDPVTVPGRHLLKDRTGSIVLLNDPTPLPPKIIADFKKQIDRLMFIEDIKITSTNSNIENVRQLDHLEVLVGINEHEVYNVDGATGIPLSILFSSLLIPTSSSKQIVNVSAIDPFYKGHVDIYENNKGMQGIVISVANVVVVKGTTININNNNFNTNNDNSNSSESLMYYIELPNNTKLPVSRDDIIINNDTYDMLLGAFKKIVDICIEKSYILEYFMQHLAAYKSYSEQTIIDQLISKIKEYIYIRNLDANILIIQNKHLVGPFAKTISTYQPLIRVNYFSGINPIDLKYKFDYLYSSGLDRYDLFKFINVKVIGLVGDFNPDDLGVIGYFFVRANIKKSSVIDIYEGDIVDPAQGLATLEHFTIYDVLDGLGLKDMLYDNTILVPGGYNKEPTVTYRRSYTTASNLSNKIRYVTPKPALLNTFIPTVAPKLNNEILMNIVGTYYMYLTDLFDIIRSFYRKLGSVNLDAVNVGVLMAKVDGGINYNYFLGDLYIRNGVEIARLGPNYKIWITFMNAVIAIMDYAYYVDDDHKKVIEYIFALRNFIKNLLLPLSRQGPTYISLSRLDTRLWGTFTFYPETSDISEDIIRYFDQYKGRCVQGFFDSLEGSRLTVHKNYDIIFMDTRYTPQITCFALLSKMKKKGIDIDHMHPAIFNILNDMESPFEGFLIYILFLYYFIGDVGKINGYILFQSQAIFSGFMTFFWKEFRGRIKSDILKVYMKMPLEELLTSHYLKDYKQPFFLAMKLYESYIVNINTPSPDILQIPTSQYHFSANTLINYVFEHEDASVAELFNSISNLNNSTANPSTSKSSTSKSSAPKLQMVEIAVNEGTSKEFVSSVITELIQNSIDAINYKIRHHPQNDINTNIDVKYITSNNRIILTVTDYIGIPLNAILALCIPFLSTKSTQDMISTGEMGTGFFNVYRYPFTQNVVISTNAFNITATPIVDKHRVIDIDYKININDPHQQSNNYINNYTTIQITSNLLTIEQLISNVLDINIYANRYLPFLNISTIENYKDHINVRFNNAPLHFDTEKVYDSDIGECYITKNGLHNSILMTNGVPFGSLAQVISNMFGAIENDDIRYNIIINLHKGHYLPVQSRNRLISNDNLVHPMKTFLKISIFHAIIRLIVNRNPNINYELYFPQMTEIISISNYYRYHGNQTIPLINMDNGIFFDSKMWENGRLNDETLFYVFKKILNFYSTKDASGAYPTPSTALTLKIYATLMLVISDKYKVNVNSLIPITGEIPGDIDEFVASNINNDIINVISNSDIINDISNSDLGHLLDQWFSRKSGYVEPHLENSEKKNIDIKIKNKLLLIFQTFADLYFNIGKKLKWTEIGYGVFQNPVAPKIIITNDNIQKEVNGFYIKKTHSIYLNETILYRHANNIIGNFKIIAYNNKASYRRNLIDYLSGTSMGKYIGNLIPAAILIHELQHSILGDQLDTSHQPININGTRIPWENACEFVYKKIMEYNFFDLLSEEYSKISNIITSK